MTRTGEEDSIRAKHFLKQIDCNLREMRRLLDEGAPVLEVYSHLEATEATCCPWWNQYEG